MITESQTQYWKKISTHSIMHIIRRNYISEIVIPFFIETIECLDNKDQLAESIVHWLSTV